MDKVRFERLIERSRDPQKLLTTALRHRVELVGWLVEHFEEWFTQKNPGLPAMLEAACSIAPNIPRKLFEQVLIRSKEGSDETVSVAAHRIRLVCPPRYLAPVGAWEGLRDWIVMRESNPNENLLRGVSSILTVGRSNAIPLILRYLAEAPTPLAYAILNEPLEWALTRNLVPAWQEALYTVTLDRLRKELSSPRSEHVTDFIHRAVWALGALAGDKDAETVAQMFFSLYREDVGIDRAAVRFGARELTRSPESKRILQEVFQQDPLLAARFWDQLERLP